MRRYAVLNSLDPENLPIGLVIERRGYVFVEAMDECCLPVRIEDPYVVRQRDLSEVTYRPGDAGYFDHVLMELSRVCVVGHQGTVEDADWGTISSLLREHVTMPRIAALRGDYAHVVEPVVMKAKALANPVYHVRGDQPLIIHGQPAGHENEADEASHAQTPTRGRHRVAA